MSESTDNYLKTIYALTSGERAGASTTALAEKLQTKASSVTDMLKKLNEKGLVKHTKYYGTSLTAKGRKHALQVVRKHRLWEFFLAEKLGFAWNEVHDVAEQLEHVQSELLIEKLDAFLNYPKYDPHGDPIPNKTGIIATNKNLVRASSLNIGDKVTLISLDDSSENFLKYLDSIELKPGVVFKVTKRIDFDASLQIKTTKNTHSISFEVAKNLFVKIKK
jgi:DtxR family transcriptional regulator, Mn-dependent transcriptional regulator